MENPGIFCVYLEYLTDQLVYFIAVWYILLSRGTFLHVLVCFEQEKSGNPGKKFVGNLRFIKWVPSGSRPP
jgi:hypothetical protein